MPKRQVLQSLYRICIRSLLDSSSNVSRDFLCLCCDEAICVQGRNETGTRRCGNCSKFLLCDQPIELPCRICQDIIKCGVDEIQLYIFLHQDAKEFDTMSLIEVPTQLSLKLFTRRCKALERFYHSRFRYGLTCSCKDQIACDFCYSVFQRYKQSLIDIEVFNSDVKSIILISEMNNLKRLIINGKPNEFPRCLRYICGIESTPGCTALECFQLKGHVDKANSSFFAWLGAQLLRHLPNLRSVYFPYLNLDNFESKTKLSNLKELNYDLNSSNFKLVRYVPNVEILDLTLLENFESFDENILRLRKIKILQITDEKIRRDYIWPGFQTFIINLGRNLTKLDLKCTCNIDIIMLLKSCRKLETLVIFGGSLRSPGARDISKLDHKLILKDLHIVLLDFHTYSGSDQQQDFNCIENVLIASVDLEVLLLRIKCKVQTAKDVLEMAYVVHGLPNIQRVVLDMRNGECFIRPETILCLLKAKNNLSEIKLFGINYEEIDKETITNYVKKQNYSMVLKLSSNPIC